MKLTIEKDVQEHNLFTLLLAFLIVLPIAFVSIPIYNEYRVKNLDTVLSFDPAYVESLEFELNGNSEPWKQNNINATEELLTFLSQYDVKKMRESEWNGDVSKEIGFRFTVYTKGDTIMASVFENRLLIYSDSGYYSVTNGPINMKWVENYNEKYD